MRRWLFFFSVWLLISNAFGCRSPQTRPSSQIRVVTSISVLEDLVEQVGGEHVQVTSLITGLENPHTYEPRASDVRTIAEAELFVAVGLGLEAWAESLVANAANPNLEVVVTSAGIPLLETGETQEKAAEGHEHGSAGGNPHIWMDPRNAQQMAAQIRDALIRKRPEWKERFERNHRRFSEELDRLLEVSRERVRQAGLQRVVSYPPAFPYFFRALGIEESARIMEVPGKDPSPRHVAEVIQTIRQHGIRVIVTIPQFNDQIPRSIAQETGARIVQLTQLLGALPGTESYVEMIRADVMRLVTAIEGTSAP